MATQDRASTNGVKVLRAMFENGSPAAELSMGRDRASPATQARNGQDVPDNARPLSKVRTAFIPVEDEQVNPDDLAKPSSKFVKSLEAAQNGGAVEGVQEEAINGHIPQREPSLDGNMSAAISSQSSGLTLAPTTPSVTVADEDDVIRDAAGPVLSSPPARHTPRRTRAADLSMKKVRPAGAAKVQSPAAKFSAHKVSAPVAEHDGRLQASQAQTRRPVRTSSAATQEDQPSFARATASNASKVRSISLATSIDTVVKGLGPGTRSATGFIKPRPRSPTRPVALPAHLTAATASSAAKRLQTSPVAPFEGGVRSRRPSTYSVASSRPSMADLTASVRSNSTRNTSSTFGPPPRQVSQPLSPNLRTRPSASFLSRMMRPTASSASKLHEPSADTHHNSPRAVSSRLANDYASLPSRPIKSGAVRNPQVTSNGHVKQLKQTAKDVAMPSKATKTVKQTASVTKLEITSNQSLGATMHVDKSEPEPVVVADCATAEEAKTSPVDSPLSFDDGVD